MIQLPDNTHLIRLDMAAAAMNSGDGTTTVPEHLDTNRVGYVLAYNSLITGLTDIWADPDGRLYCRPKDVVAIAGASVRDATRSYIDIYKDAVDNYGGKAMTKAKGAGATGPAPTTIS